MSTAGAPTDINTNNTDKTHEYMNNPEKKQGFDIVFLLLAHDQLEKTNEDNKDT